MKRRKTETKRRNGQFQEIEPLLTYSTNGRYRCLQPLVGLLLSVYDFTFSQERKLTRWSSGLLHPVVRGRDYRRIWGTFPPPEWSHSALWIVHPSRRLQNGFKSKSTTRFSFLTLREQNLQWRIQEIISSNYVFHQHWILAIPVAMRFKAWV
jgi:hypothetical protein